MCIEWAWDKYHLFEQVLDSTGTSEAEYDVFRDVVLPLGRSPTFATRSGGWLIILARLFYVKKAFVYYGKKGMMVWTLFKVRCGNSCFLSGDSFLRNTSYWSKENRCYLPVQSRRASAVLWRLRGCAFQAKDLAPRGPSYFDYSRDAFSLPLGPTCRMARPLQSELYPTLYVA